MSFYLSGFSSFLMEPNTIAHMMKNNIFLILEYMSVFYSFQVKYKTEAIERMDVKLHSCVIKIPTNTRKASSYLNYLDYGKEHM